MVDPAERTNNFHRHRYGVCHRCGWKGSVAKVGRHERALLGTNRTYGRLCDECVADLLRSKAPLRETGAPGTVQLKADDFDVA